MHKIPSFSLRFAISMNGSFLSQYASFFDFFFLEAIFNCVNLFLLGFTQDSWKQRNKALTLAHAHTILYTSS